MSLFGLFGFQPPKKKETNTLSRKRKKKKQPNCGKTKHIQKSLVQLKPSFLFQNMFMVLPGLHSG